MVIKQKRVIALLAWIGVVVLSMFAALAAYTNVPTSLTPADIAVFENEFGLRKSPLPPDYKKQIELIRSIQAKGFAAAPYGKGIPDYQTREPVDLIQAAEGRCYDRSRTFDKALIYAGFKTRHVFLLYREGESFWSTLTRPGSRSHAVTEVKTTLGWLVVDSNLPWIAVTRAGVPVDANNVWKRLDEFDEVPEELSMPWWAVRGLFSRHGKLYPPYIPFPDINWQDFLTAPLS